jgi:nucleoside-specific outer membrane channel protein Tsx
VTTYYGEFSPRLSFGKIFDRNLAFGPIKDVLLAMTYERGEGDNEAYLIGPGFDLNVPGFNYFTLNFYLRNTEGSRPATTSGRSPRLVVHHSRGPLRHSDRRLHGLGY